MCAICIHYDWDLAKSCSVVGFPRECAPVECCNFAPIIDPYLINSSSVLLCTNGDDDMPSLCVSPDIFDRVLSHPAVPGVSVLVVASVRFDVPGPV